MSASLRLIQGDVTPGQQHAVVLQLRAVSTRRARCLDCFRTFTVRHDEDEEWARYMHTRSGRCPAAQTTPSGPRKKRNHVADNDLDYIGAW